MIRVAVRYKEAAMDYEPENTRYQTHTRQMFCEEISTIPGSVIFKDVDGMPLSIPYEYIEVLTIGCHTLNRFKEEDIHDAVLSACSYKRSV